jgi:SsrA-binding protein
MAKNNDETTVLASNRRARHDYTILDVVEAGIVLHGSEVKSVREGLVQIAESYAHEARGEMWLENMHVSAYKFSHGVGAHDPVRPRKLLLNRNEIRRLAERMAKERLTLVPLDVHLRDGRVKIELALAKGRKKEDRRAAIAEKESKIEMRRAVGRQRRGKTE